MPWTTKEYFQSSAENALHAALDNLGCNVKPRVHVIGVNDTGHVYSVPASTSRYNLAGICRRCRQQTDGELADDKDNICYSYWRATQFSELFTQFAAQVVNARDGLRYESFLSAPAQQDNCTVFVLVQFSKEDAAKLGLRREGHGCSGGDCFLSAFVESFLVHVHRELQIPTAGAAAEYPRPEELCRDAGRRIMQNVFGVGELFGFLTNISSLYYEHSVVRGSLVLQAWSKPNLTPDLLTFATQVPIQKARSVRKLLEICGDDQMLVCDGPTIIGLCRRTHIPQRSNMLYEVSFAKQHCWQLRLGQTVIMDVTLGVPTLLVERITQKQFFSAMKGKFGELNPYVLERTFEIIQEAMASGHGTTIVFSSSAEAESRRLSKQSMPILPISLTVELFRQLSRIDGAILCSPSCECHAIGVILDGEATALGDSARGSRYNSAVRYVEFRRDAVAIVVSDDGMVDLIKPSPLPPKQRPASAGRGTPLPSRATGGAPLAAPPVAVGPPPALGTPIPPPATEEALSGATAAKEPTPVVDTSLSAPSTNVSSHAANSLPPDDSSQASPAPVSPSHSS